MSGDRPVRVRKEGRGEKGSGMVTVRWRPPGLPGDAMEDGLGLPTAAVGFRLGPAVQPGQIEICGGDGLGKGAGCGEVVSGLGRSDEEVEREDQPPAAKGYRHGDGHRILLVHDGPARPEAAFRPRSVGSQV